MNSRVFGIFYTFLISAVFVAVLATLNAVTRPRIVENEKMRLQSSILNAAGLVQPGEILSREEISNLFDEYIRVIEDPVRDVYIALHKEGRVFVFLVSSPGLWGTITAVLAIEEGFTRITGIDFFEHSETPGLGGRIDEIDFKDQFRELLISDDPRARISVVRFEEASKDKSQVEAITGATRTSESIQELINKAINDVLPLIVEVLGEHNGR